MTKGFFIYLALWLVAFGVYVWLLNVICRTWHLPFWGIFWAFLLFEVALLVDKRLDQLWDAIA